MTSNAITIDGTDHNMDLSDAGTSMGVALGVGGDPTYIESQLEARNLNKMTGDPKVGQVATYDLDAMITQGAQAATIRLQDGSTSKPENPGDWGTADAPAILYGSGDISIASGTSGVGILIVDGNLRTTGGFEWRGLIIVRGGVYLGGGGNKNRVVGSVIVQNALSDEGSASLTNSGSSDLIYSREALRLVRTKFASAYLVTNWREAPTRGEVVLP